MSDKSLNSQIISYKKTLASGEFQKTYQSLVSIIQSLRNEFHKTYRDEFSVASVMHGYVDFTYFYLQNDYLKKHKLKLAVVLNHQKVQFELWVLGQTKNVQIEYWKKLRGTKWVNPEVMPEYSIFEIVILDNPDFNNLLKLSESIHSEFMTRSNEVFDILVKCQ